MELRTYRITCSSEAFVNFLFNKHGVNYSDQHWVQDLFKRKQIQLVTYSGDQVTIKTFGTSYIVGLFTDEFLFLTKTRVKVNLYGTRKTK